MIWTLSWFTENQIIFKPRTYPIWYRDLFGLLFNALTLTFFSFIITVPTVLVLTGLDPLNFVLPPPPETSSILDSVMTLHFIFRVIMCTLVIAEIASTVGLAHISLVMLLLYSKMCINSIKFYRKPNSDVTVAQRLSRWRKSKNNQMDETKPNLLLGLSDLDLYSILMVQFRLVRQYSDTAAVFIMGPGFLIDVIANYVAIMMFDKLPLLLYLAISMLAILAPILIMGELPQAGKSNTCSISLINHFRGGSSQKLSPWKRRKVRSLHPTTIWIGSFFSVKRQTLSIYVDGILNYTVNAIMLL